ncbi:MAG TPA: tRNA (adenosine(37)-N6)-threonylcarbamoyltransferase complex ATPase subunit type 1 TsaE [Limnochordia bacterium]|nr:tRNA (adenosine(37)-N6)-threonylcarbamoyltransferase complex ATPase subunit type 1 TsaE [Limnochordia bacterium]
MQTRCRWLSQTPEETAACGGLLGEAAQPGDVIVLDGPLGSGKTLFAKGVAQALGIDPGRVTSPTFTYLQPYRGRLPLYHFDLYRLEPGTSLDGFGFGEWIEGDGVSLIEWGRAFLAQLPPDPLLIEFAPAGEARRLEFIAGGGRGAALAEHLCACLGA